MKNFSSVYRIRKRDRECTTGIPSIKFSFGLVPGYKNDLWKSARQPRWDEKAPFNAPDFAVVRLFQLMSTATRGNVQLASDNAKYQGAKELADECFGVGR
jgi:hypothetical protein